MPPSICMPVRPEVIPQLVQARKVDREAKAAIEKRKAEILRTQHGFCEEGQEGDSY